MTLNLSPDVEAIARAKAAQAGLPDVETFVQRLIENALPEQALLPPPSDPRIVAAISAGLASGTAGEMDEAFWKERTGRLEKHIAEKQRSDSCS